MLEDKSSSTSNQPFQMQQLMTVLWMAGTDMRHDAEVEKRDFRKVLFKHLGQKLG